MAGTMSTRLLCCFRVFYDYPSWRTWGSPFVPHVPGYLKTRIIHSFLTILNYKTVCACRSSIMDIPPVHNQPKTFKFPQRSFGPKKKNKVKRSFQSSWFANRMWLHYGEANDLAYCHVRMGAYRDRKLNSSNLEKVFILNGFSNWKDAIVAFKKHDSSRCHRDSVRGQNSMFVLSDTQT